METEYLVVGGGMTADAACRGIREVDPDASILIVSDEAHPPYARPPLSKGLWKGGEERKIWRQTAELGVHEELGRRVVALDLEARAATGEQGEVWHYEKLLLATGGRPRRVAGWGEDVIYFRTLDDYRRLRLLADRGGRFCVVGGGFIGSEIAAALRLSGCEVTMVFPEAGIGARVFPAGLSAALVEHFRGQGVEVLAHESVSRISPGPAEMRVRLGNGRVLEVDAVVAGLGIEPNVELAAAAGLPVSNGIVVDAFGRVGGREDVFAAGDVARFPVAALGTELRVEHEDHAVSHGRRVGANMAGASERYDHLPFFYSDLFELGYEAVGHHLDSRLDVEVGLGALEEEGVVTYLGAQRRPRGVLLWNRFGHVEEARELIRAGRPVAAGALAAAP